jgi:hypothetical protein
MSSSPSRPNRREFTVSGLAVPFALPQAITHAQDASPEVGTSADDLRALEKARLRSLVDFDMETAMALHAEDFQLINPAGGALTREEYLGSLQDGFIDYLVFEPAGEIRVHLAPGAGVLRYMSNLEIIVGGQRMPLANFWHTDYYEYRDGSWQAVLSQATEVLASTAIARHPTPASRSLP